MEKLGEVVVVGVLLGDVVDLLAQVGDIQKVTAGYRLPALGFQLVSGGQEDVFAVVVEDLRLHRGDAALGLLGHKGRHVFHGPVPLALLVPVGEGDEHAHRHGEGEHKGDDEPSGPAPAG